MTKLMTFQIVTPSTPPAVPANGTAAFTAEARTTGNPGLLSDVVSWSVTDSNGTPAPGCETVLQPQAQPALVAAR